MLIMTERYISKNEQKLIRITELRNELENLLWNTKETDTRPSWQDWNAWIILEIQSIRKCLIRIEKNLH